MLARILAALTALTLLAVPAAAGAATTDRGTASTALRAGGLTITGLPAGSEPFTLPSLRSFASTDSDPQRNVPGAGTPFASAAVALPVVGEVAARSDGPTSQAGRSVALPQDLGSVTAGRLEATVAGGTARSRIDALAGQLVLVAGGLTLDVPSTGASSVVHASAAEAVNGATMRDLRLGLTDVVPAALLAEFPLDVLVDLVALVPALDLSPVATDVIALLEGVELAATRDDGIAEVSAAIAELQAELDEATAERDALLSDLASAEALVQELQQAFDELEALGDEAALRQALADAEDELAAALTEIEELEAQLLDVDCASLLIGDPLFEECERLAELTAALPDLQQAVEDAELALTTLLDAEAALADATAALAVLQALVDEAQGVVADLTAQIGALVTELEALLEQLVDLLVELVALLERVDVTDVVATVTELVDGLAGLDLLAIDALRVGVAATAGARSSAATVSCRVEGVTVLGTDLPTMRCAELADELDDLETTVTGLLEALPLSGTVGDVTVDGLTTTTTAPGQRSGAYHVATAGISALHVDVPSVELQATLEGLLGVDAQALIDLLADGLLADALALVGVDGDGLGDLTEADVAVLVADLETLLAVLPATTQLTQVGTPALGLDVLAIGAAAEFTAGAGTTPVSTPAVTTPPAAPRPATPGTLPRTGGGSGLLALALLGMGGGGAYALRSRRRA